MIKLDPALSDTQKAVYANVVQRVDEPLISTSKDIDTKFIFRTLTPVDFSADNKKLVVKEKVGHRHDGIWKTDLWVYDFEKKEAIKLPQIREAIMEYWAQVGGIDFEDHRWDIYPMGFDANNDDRVILSAYAYTGEVPKFLGTWSIDVAGVNSKLENLDGNAVPVSVIGYRLAEDSVRDASEVEFEAKQAEKAEKIEKKAEKKDLKYENKIKKLEYKRKIEQMDIDVYYQIKQRRDKINEMKKIKKQAEATTGVN